MHMRTPIAQLVVALPEPEPALPEPGPADPDPLFGPASTPPITAAPVGVKLHPTTNDHAIQPSLTT